MYKYREAHDCMDAGFRVMQEPEPRDARERPFPPTNAQSLSLLSRLRSVCDLEAGLLDKHALFLKLSKNFTFLIGNFAAIPGIDLGH